MYPVEFEEKGGKVIGEGAPTWVDENLPNTAAALWYSTETGLLYAAKRSEGTVVGFTSPEVKPVERHTCLGKQSRDFALLPSNAILIACQDAGLTLIRNG